jgi:hypothetical protein
MSVEAWKTLFDWATVVLIALTVVSGAGALITGNIIGKQQDERLLQFEGSLTSARTELGKQQARAAKAEQDASEAKTTATKTNERAAALEKDAAQAKAAQQRVEIDLAKQKEKAATAEHALLQLQRRAEPRRISADQRVRLVALLSQSPKGKVSISCVLGDGEGLAFAKDIDDVLKAAGWETNFGQGVYSGGNPVGFGIVVRNAISAPPYATALQRAFFSVGIPVAGEENPQLNAGDIQIIVGNKPN